jgi:hypothetical protein
MKIRFKKETNKGSDLSAVAEMILPVKIFPC